MFVEVGFDAVMADTTSAFFFLRNLYAPASGSMG